MSPIIVKILPLWFRSDFGFQGCIASLELNGVMIDPMKVWRKLISTTFNIDYCNLKKDALVPSQSVIEGCQGECQLTEGLFQIFCTTFGTTFSFSTCWFFFIILCILITKHIYVYPTFVLNFRRWKNILKLNIFDLFKNTAF